MNKDLIEKIKKTFEHDNTFEKFPDFITDIHFPCFKGLVSYSEIKFQFPLTVLVGENGCGKSSVLQALETTPEGSSYSQKWFSTQVDPIPEKPRPAFWYSYNSLEAKQNVQILNQRIKKDNNPDYWEPSRPVEKYGMKLFHKEMANTPGASGTRWNGTKRNVLYLDFRGELSAFDKYFYFGDKPNTITLKSKQDYIRYYAVYLKGMVSGWINEGFIYKNKKKVDKIVHLSEEEVEIVSTILDKNYSEITLMKHCFYKQWGESVYFKLQNVKTETFTGNYTEAFAGSGESAVTKLVHQVYQAKKGTLVLLDEPEVSLHPGAQKRLIDFLLHQTFEKGLQIILTTHSPSIVEKLPKEAIVLLYQTSDGLFSPKCSIEPELAFQYIGHTNIEQSKIVVEDKCAELLAKRALHLLDQNANKTIDVVFHAGGATDIYKEAVVLSRLNIKKTFLLLDGDQKHDIPFSGEIPDNILDQTITDITGVSVKDLGFLADSGKQTLQLFSEKRKYLDFLKTNCFFLPMNTPEEILWKCSSKSPKTIIDESQKDAYKNAIADWVKSDIEGDVTATDILTYQKKLCNSISENDSVIIEIINILKGVIG